MAETDQWLADYGASHDSVSNRASYWAGITAMVLGVVGLLWSLPVPENFLDISPFLNWGTTFLMAAVVYYFIISVSLALGMLPLVLAIAAGELWLDHSRYPLQLTAAGLVVIGIFGLMLGRRRAGGTAAVMRDIQLLMIAPAWLLSRLYRRLGIPF